MDLELRMDVARALGCDPEMVTVNDEFPDLPVCRCEDRRHGPMENDILPALLEFYELDDHDALDALKEFCKTNILKFTVTYLPRGFLDGRDFYEVVIYSDNFKYGAISMVESSLATAACLAIQAAAKGGR